MLLNCGLFCDIHSIFREGCNFAKIAPEFIMVCSPYLKYLVSSIPLSFTETFVQGVGGGGGEATSHTFS